MRYREAARKLARLGVTMFPDAAAALTGSGINLQAQKDATLPDWGSRDLKIGPLRSAIRQLGMDWSEFQVS